MRRSASHGQVATEPRALYIAVLDAPFKVLLAVLFLTGCICPFDKSQCLHAADPVRFVSEYGHCQEGGGPLVEAANCKLETPTASCAGKATLSKAEIADVIRKDIWKIRWCYQSAREAFYSQPWARMAGQIRVKFVIQSDGSVESAKVQSNSSSPSLGCCVLETIRALRFPAPKGEGFVVVSYPFTFTD